jgi:hypothetical protein
LQLVTPNHPGNRQLFSTFAHFSGCGIISVRSRHYKRV